MKTLEDQHEILKKKAREMFDDLELNEEEDDDQNSNYFQAT